MDPRTSMYRGSTSPIFDAPEFAPLRRVKPLPKRRRTSGDPLTVPDSAAEFVSELIENSPVHHLSASMYSSAIPSQQYYVEGNGVANSHYDTDVFFRTTDAGDDRSSEFPGGFAIPVGPADEDDHGDGDYVDHLQQPGNTKKRKVPAAHHSNADALSSPVATGDDESEERGHLASGGIGSTEAADVAPPLPPPPQSFVKRYRFSPATHAGLQHKELLKTRKRQLAAVLGAITHGDTLALDQALSARYSNLGPLPGKENVPVNKSRRRSSRRLPLSWARSPIPSNEGMDVPMPEFSFACPSPTSERLISTREEVAVLHSRFEAELARQAAKAAEMARQSALAGDGKKRAQRSKTITSGVAMDANAGTKSRNSKKKKRSALANASNPHHLRNYVPSRLPHSGAPLSQGGGNLNLVSPLPVQFLTAEIPPRRRRKPAPPSHLLAPLTQPEDEWICPMCEYSLFYGDDAAFRRAIRSRKKILVRRRRARERAAAAASGQKTGVAPLDKGNEAFDSTLEEEYGPTNPDSGLMGNRGGGGGGRRERDRGDGRGGGHT